MDLFTQSVDASLWRSRCGEDPLDDDNPEAAAESGAPVTATITATTPIPPPILVVADGGSAASALSALAPSNSSIATLQGPAAEDTSVELCTSGPLAGCAITQLPKGVPEHRACAWARSLIKAAGAQAVLCMTSTTRANFRGKLSEGKCVHALATTAATPNASADIPPLREPMFVTGAAAAVLSEAEGAGQKGVCLVAVLERANFVAYEVRELAAAVCAVAAAFGGAGGGVDGEIEKRIRAGVKRSAVVAHDSIYL